MNNNTPSNESVNPLTVKLMLIGGGILIMVMLVLTVRSIVGILRSSPSSPAGTETAAAQPNPPAGISLFPASDNSEAQPPPVSAPDNSKPAASPPPLAVQAEIARQREKARIETIAALKRDAQAQAGTSAVPKEVLQKLEQSDSIVY